MDERKIPQCILNIFKFTANSTDLFDWGAHLSPSCWTLMLTGKVQQRHFQMYYDCSLSASLQKRFQIIYDCSMSASLPAGSRWSTSAYGAVGAEREIERDEKELPWRLFTSFLPAGSLFSHLAWLRHRLFVCMNSDSAVAKCFSLGFYSFWLTIQNSQVPTEEISPRKLQQNNHTTNFSMA